MDSMHQSVPDGAQPAVDVLFSFFQKMHQWEKDLIAFDADKGKTSQQHAHHLQQQKNRLGEIFSVYCEAGAQARRLQDEGLSYMGCGDTEYDPQREEIVSIVIKNNKIVITTRQLHAYQFKLRYELVLIEGKWLIRDNRKSSFHFEDKWRSYPL